MLLCIRSHGIVYQHCSSGYLISPIPYYCSIVLYRPFVTVTAVSLIPPIGGVSMYQGLVFCIISRSSLSRDDQCNQIVASENSGRLKRPKINSSFHQVPLKIWLGWQAMPTPGPEFNENGPLKDIEGSVSGKHDRFIFIVTLIFD